MTPTEFAITAAKQACYDANEIVRLIDVLRAGNEEAIRPEINRRKAAPTAITIQGALFTRLHLVVCRHFGRSKQGDYSAATAFKMLADRDVLKEVSAMGADLNQVKEWRLVWEVWQRSPQLKSVIHLRNKEVAHLSFLDPATPKPIIRQIFDVAEQTARLLDQLARALRCDSTNLEFERKEQRKSAEAFWGIWKT